MNIPSIKSLKMKKSVLGFFLVFIVFSLNSQVEEKISEEPGILEIFQYKNDSELSDYNPNKKQYWIFKKSGEISKNINNLILETVFNEGLAIAHDPITKKVAFIDENFNKVIEYGKGYNFTNFNEGVAWVNNGKSDPYLINKKNQTLTICKSCSQVNIYSEGMAAFKDKNDQWGFLDKSGNVLFKLPKNIFYVSKFSSGMAQFFIQEPNSDKIKFGYINNIGKYAIKPIFTYFEDNGGIDQLIYGDDDDRNKFIGENAYILENKSDTSLSANSESTANEYLINKKGDIISDSLTIQKFAISIYNKKESSTEELIPQKQKNKIGYVNSQNKFIINPIYDEGSEFSNGIADVRIGKKNYLISKTGKIIFEYPKFKYLTRVMFYTKPDLDYIEGQGLGLINVLRIK